MSIIADYRNAYFESLNIEIDGHRHLFLTGHKDGKVHLWRSDSYIGVLTDYKDEVTCMTKCYEGLAICTWRGFIHLWDTNLKNCTKTIELASLPFKILSFNISSIDYN
jgi:WD40 repeat protein